MRVSVLLVKRYHSISKTVLAFAHNKYIRLRYLFPISIGLLIAGLVIVSLSRPFTSDDVVIQNVFHQYFRLHGTGTAWLAEDNFLIKVPFYLFLDAFFNNSRSVLLGTSIVLNIIGFGLFFYSYVYFMKLFKLFEALPRLALIWLFSLSVTLGTWFLLNPNLRNVEIGISFLALVGFSKYMHGDLNFSGKRGKLTVSLLVLAFGLFIYSDPFFIGMLLAPILIMCLALLYQRKQLTSSIRVVAFLMLSYFVMAVLHNVLPHFHILSRNQQLLFTSFDKLGWTIGQTIQALMVIFGANFWGKDVLSLGTLRAMINLLILIAIVATPITLLRRKPWRTYDPWLIFWLLQPAFIIAVYILSNNTALNGYGSIRYLALLPFYVPVILALGYEKVFTQPHLRRRLTAVLIVAILLNCAAMFNQVLHRPPVNPNIVNYNAIGYLENKGVTKGVAHYWNSQILTYLSNNAVTVIPVNCFQIQHLLMNDKTIAVPAKKSFYLYDPGYASQCSEAELQKILGPPVDSVNLTNTQKIFLYNYDITTKLTSGYFN